MKKYNTVSFKGLNTIEFNTWCFNRYTTSFQLVNNGWILDIVTKSVNFEPTDEELRYCTVLGGIHFGIMKCMEQMDDVTNRYKPDMVINKRLLA